MTKTDINLPEGQNPNPQGKGLSAILSDWQYYCPQQWQEKSNEQLFADYFTSTLVLSAEFGFKPVIGQQYYLYFHNKQWALSLIEPERWQKAPGICFGQCQLYADMTWSIAPQADSLKNQILIQALKSFSHQLHQHLMQNHSTGQLLPFFAEQLPYYRRMVASGMARSRT